MKEKPRNKERQKRETDAAPLTPRSAKPKSEQPHARKAVQEMFCGAAFTRAAPHRSVI